MNIDKKILYKIASLVWEFSTHTNRNYFTSSSRLKEETFNFIELDESVFTNIFAFERLTNEFIHIITYIWELYGFNDEEDIKKPLKRGANFLSFFYSTANT